MRLKEVSASIFDKLEADLRALGFKANRSKNRFVRKVNGANNIIDFSLSKYSNGVKIEVELYVLIDSINSLYRKLVGENLYYHLGLNLIDVKRYYETGSEEPLDSSEEVHFFIQSEDEVDVFCNEMIGMYRQYGERYFSENSSLEAVDEKLNSEHLRNAIIHHRMYSRRVLVGIIAASLSDNPEFWGLLEIYDSEMRDAAPMYVSAYQKVRDFLLGQTK